MATEIGRPYRQVLSAALFDSGYLTDTEGSAPRPHDEVLHAAISVLTEASRLTNQPMRQTSSGQWEADPDPRAALPIDWAAFVTDALGGAAANAGGIDTILSGRPGSWEASVIGDALRAAVGRDEWDLWRHRTEPVTVAVHPERILFDDDSSNHFDEMDAAEAEIQRRENATEPPPPAGLWLAASSARSATSFGGTRLYVIMGIFAGWAFSAVIAWGPT